MEISWLVIDYTLSTAKKQKQKKKQKKQKTTTNNNKQMFGMEKNHHFSQRWSRLNCMQTLLHGVYTFILLTQEYIRLYKLCRSNASTTVLLNF